MIGPMDDLYRYVSEGIRREKGRLRELSKAADVSYSWITHFNNPNRKGDVSHNALQRVARALRELPQ